MEISKAAASFEKLREIVARLRGPDGCPWDREQTAESLVPALLEEAYEVSAAIRAGDVSNQREELGDLLLVILMEAQIAAENGRFEIAQVIEEVAQKLVRRHPHVFGEVKLPDSDLVLRQWEAIKRTEKGPDQHYLGSLPQALPALMRAQKAQKKAARVDFDWRDLRDVLSKVDEELAETRDALVRNDAAGTADEIGDLLFAVVNLARKVNLEAETLLQQATDKFVARFNEMEDRLRTRGGKLGTATLAELDAIWNQIKADQRSATIAGSNAKRECS